MSPSLSLSLSVSLLHSLIHCVYASLWFPPVPLFGVVLVFSPLSSGSLSQQ